MAKKRTRLTFNRAKATDDLMKILADVSNEIMLRFFYESTDGLEKSGGVDIEQSQLINGMILSRVLFDAESIMESFGTGSLMDKNSKYLQDYKNSELWNPSRNSNVIVGRPIGIYTNIFGENQTADGVFDGRYLESKYPPIPPKYTIQNAEKWFMQKDGYVKRYLKIEIEKWINTLPKYFKSV